MLRSICVKGEIVMKRCATSEDSVRLPDWYWQRGLHDAVIAFTEALEPPYGCGTHAQHNCLKLHLDSRDARESDIRCIALYDYEFAEGDLPKAGSWWLGDGLQQEAGRYILRAEWTDNREVYSFKVHFSSAEVERR